MDFHCAHDSNVVQLSDILRERERSAHRCGFNCLVEHVWANLYVCKSTGNSHVCDKNCDQRIIYDNHSSICRASRRMFPLNNSTTQVAIHGVRRKHDLDGGHGQTKRSRSLHNPFEQQMGLPACLHSAENMDTA